MCNFMGKEQSKAFGPKAFDTPTNSDKKKKQGWSMLFEFEIKLLSHFDRALTVLAYCL